MPLRSYNLYTAAAVSPELATAANFIFNLGNDRDTALAAMAANGNCVLYSWAIEGDFLRAPHWEATHTEG